MTRVTYIFCLALFAALAPSLHASGSRFAAAVFPGGCRIAPIAFRGWHAEQLENGWVTLTIVPQLGGRLMQIVFAGHAYLFINPRYEGKYIPPAEVPERQWINYGGIVRVSVHLVDAHGNDRGALGETRVALPRGGH